MASIKLFKMQLPRTNTAFWDAKINSSPSSSLRRRYFKSIDLNSIFLLKIQFPSLAVSQFVKYERKERKRKSLSLCNSIDYTVHGILQARILERVAFPFSRGSSQPKDWTQVSHIAVRFFTCWATRGVLCRVWRLVQIGVCGFWLPPQKLPQTLLVASFLVPISQDLPRLLPTFEAVGIIFSLHGWMSLHIFWEFAPWRSYSCLYSPWKQSIPLIHLPYNKSPTYEPSSCKLSKMQTCIWFQQGTWTCAIMAWVKLQLSLHLLLLKILQL